jgi:hypothetical protein
MLALPRAQDGDECTDRASNEKDAKPGTRAQMISSTTNVE